MSEDLFQGNSGRRTDFEAVLNEVATVGRHPSPKSDVGRTNLFICLKGDVTTNHVI